MADNESENGMDRNEDDSSSLATSDFDSSLECDKNLKENTPLTENQAENDTASDTANTHDESSGDENFDAHMRNNNFKCRTGNRKVASKCDRYQLNDESSDELEKETDETTLKTTIVSSAGSSIHSNVSPNPTGISILIPNTNPEMKQLN